MSALMRTRDTESTMARVWARDARPHTALSGAGAAAARVANDGAHKNLQATQTIFVT